MLLRAFAAHADVARTAAIAGEWLDADVDEALVRECLLAFAELGLLEAPGLTLEQLRERQRQARRRHYEHSRAEKLRALLPRLRALPFYARTLPAAAGEAAVNLKELPVLDKAAVRAHFDEFLPERMPAGEIRWLSTSGTTGERQQVVRSLADWDASQPHTWALNRTIEAARGERFCRLTTPFCDGSECHLRGASRASRTRGPRLSLDGGLDIAALPPARLEQMAAELREHAPAYVLADPSYLAMFADQALRRRLPLPRLRFVITAYELCSALHRRILERVFECPVFDAYGATEYGALAVQCEAGRYHVNPESFLVELRDDAAGDDARELLVTTLDKLLMPLLRYATGDLARPADAPCTCAWSESDTLASLEGRAVDSIRTTDGRRLTAGAVDRALAPAAPGIVSYGLVQRGEASYRLDYLPAEDFSEQCLPDVAAALHAALGPGARVQLARRPELLPASSGKFRLAYVDGRPR
ncbi:Phenylacetate-coenzyme A ligase PaaK, adenylate-forming domain family [Nannocystis exedens]|uniref:Phenylacetate-coenzyme A ligase PaaK, adenylate-forming domain family n=1 Tax=Nannocystis exedens TaxID=54 RepID=A0A1I2ENA6_9BACT|nr:phenylacetate--CoA ligase family protein [Nannocystis exedens]PCC73911.1 Phenylacetate-coenzyme A ligase [Nannocystis exedens]SFE94365.1 Phenylacetate-coenzyme A ligase PaaK, adenylate-forming domain family [Nannocystis exedens]